MRRSLARCSAPGSSVHAPSWADFITTMVGFRFSVHTPVTPTFAFPHDTASAEMSAQFDRRLMVNCVSTPYMDNLAWPGLVTVANLPATVVPTRRLVGGLPASPDRRSVSWGPHHIEVRATSAARDWMSQFKGPRKVFSIPPVETLVHPPVASQRYSQLA
jgi:hypothetical protein